MTDSRDHAIAALAARQQRNITRQQLLEIGLTDNAIAHRIGAGRLHRTFPGVFTVGTPARTPLERASAAVLACAPTGMLSEAAAMSLWGFWARWEEPLEVTITSGNRRPTGIRVHRCSTIKPGDVRTHFGIRVTSPARTFLDVAPRRNDKQLARDVNNALHSLWLTRDQLAAALKRHPNHPSTKRLMYFVTTTDGPTRADWERELPAFCAARGLPRPILSAKIGRHTVDAVFPAEMVILELDGWAFHNTRTDFETDRDRDADTAALGYVTVRITWYRLIYLPEREAARLHTILEVRRRRVA